MIYGTNIFSAINDGTTSFSGRTYCKTQLALFAATPKFITNRIWYWLRDVVSGGSFANVGNGGDVNYGVAFNTYGVRPVFAIGIG